MVSVKIIHTIASHTLTIWLDDPAKEAVREEAADAVVLVKDAAGRVIGFEVLNYRPTTQEARVLVETIVHSAS